MCPKCVCGISFLTTRFFTTQQFWEGWKSAFVPCYLPSIRLKYIVGEVLISPSLDTKGGTPEGYKIHFEQWVRVYNLDCSRPVVILDFFLDKKKHKWVEWQILEPRHSFEEHRNIWNKIHKRFLSRLVWYVPARGKQEKKCKRNFLGGKKPLKTIS